MNRIQKKGVINVIKLKEKGFTLVEIMIVVAIIAILSAIAIPNFMAARSKSRANACKANIRQIDSSLEQVAMDRLLTNGDICQMEGGNTGIVPTYIKKLPTCQASGNYGATGAWCVNATLTGSTTFTATQFEIGSTPWCDIGSGSASGGYPHILYQ